MRKLFYLMLLGLAALAFTNEASAQTEVTLTGDLLFSVGGAADPGLDGEAFTITYTFADGATASAGGGGSSFFTADSVTLDILGTEVAGAGDSLFIIQSDGDVLLGIGGAPSFNTSLGQFNFSASDAFLEGATFIEPGDTFGLNDLDNATITDSTTAVFIEAGAPDAFFSVANGGISVTSSVPEPGSCAVLGLAGLVAMRRRRR